MDIVVLIGRILFSILFLASGGAHFAMAEDMTGYAASMGVKPAKPAVLISGLMIVAGGLMVALGLWLDLGAALIIAFLVPTAFLMSPFWKMEGEMRQTEQVQFMKNLSLAGAALAILGLAGIVGSDLGLTITGPLFSD